MIEYVKKILRRVVRLVCLIPIKGRHRLVKFIGVKIKPINHTEVIFNNGLSVKIDHRIYFSQLVY